ncbi:MAG TPA: SAF domain-containing protein [Candidatus Obscuribacterales bacterium]
MTRNQAFVVGNLVGVAVLIAGIMITAPHKMKEQEELDAKNKQAVVVSVRTIEKGETLSPENVVERRIERKDVPLNAVESGRKANGMVARQKIEKDAIVLYADVVLSPLKIDGARKQ